MEKINRRMLIAVLSCLTLGLAPFNEPHIWSKLVLIFNGQAPAFKMMDWLDVFMHGAPWLFLIVVVIQLLRAKLKKENTFITH